MNDPTDTFHFGDRVRLRHPSATEAATVDNVTGDVIGIILAGRWFEVPASALRLDEPDL